MNIWTAFFLVVSIVILAAPLVLTREAPDRTGAESVSANDTGFVPEEDELELDLALERFSQDDFEIVRGRKLNTASPDNNAREGHGNIPEG